MTEALVKYEKMKHWSCWLSDFTYVDWMKKKLIEALAVPKELLGDLNTNRCGTH